jgi:hypothetical protein
MDGRARVPLGGKYPNALLCQEHADRQPTQPGTDDQDVYLLLMHDLPLFCESP